MFEMKKKKTNAVNLQIMIFKNITKKCFEKYHSIVFYPKNEIKLQCGLDVYYNRIEATFKNQVCLRIHIGLIFCIWPRRDYN